MSCRNTSAGKLKLFNFQTALIFIFIFADLLPQLTSLLMFCLLPVYIYIYIYATEKAGQHAVMKLELSQLWFMACSGIVHLQIASSSIYFMVFFFYDLCTICAI